MAKNEGYAGSNEGERHESGEKEPKGAASSDRGGERKKGIVNGVGMGKADGTGGRSAGGKDMGEYNEGRQSDGAVCYSHKRIPHAQDGK